MAFDDWSQTAGSNTTVGGVSIAEGMDPASLNNALRGLMAEVAVWRDLVGGKVVSGGSANAQTITTGMAMGAYAQGIPLGFEAGFTNTAATTINVDAIAAKNVRNLHGAALVGGEIVAGQLYLLAYEATADVLFLLNPTFPGQLVFPATQNASSGANTLDDYEEGTWTPVLTVATPGDLSVAYTSQVGTYTKIGRKVTLTCHITTSTFTHSTASGTARITGVPFTSNSTAAYKASGAISWQGITKASYTDINAVIGDGAVIIFLQASGSAQSVSSVAATDMPTGGTVIIQFTLTFSV